MTKTKFLMIAIGSLAVSACGTMGTNTSMYSVHQPVVERTNYAIDVSANGGTLSMAETQRMTEWFDALQLRYGDRVAFDYGDGYPSPAFQQAVSKMVANYGLIVGDTAPVTSGAIGVGLVRVVVTRSAASVPSCPDWSTTDDRNYNTSNHSNYGCSVNSNLAAMVADPEDLVRGRQNGVLDNNSGKAAINAYRAKTGGN